MRLWLHIQFYLQLRFPVISSRPLTFAHHQEDTVAIISLLHIQFYLQIHFPVRFSVDLTSSPRHSSTPPHRGPAGYHYFALYSILPRELRFPAQFTVALLSTPHLSLSLSTKGYLAFVIIWFYFQFHRRVVFSCPLIRRSVGLSVRWSIKVTCGWRVYGFQALGFLLLIVPRGFQRWFGPIISVIPPPRPTVF